MANKTIAQLDSISDSIDNIEDLAILYDTSATKTVKTTIQNLLTTQLSGLNTSGKNVINAINEVYSKINETISEIASEEDSPASSNHNPGELILYNGNLYRTISYIVTGESLIDIGDSANIENITISECIKELYDTQVLLGNETIETDANTITGAINQHEGHITALDSKVGNTEMGTTATTLTGAINQHETDISELNSNLSEYFEGESKIVTTNNNEVFLRVRGKIATLVINVSSILDQTFAVIPEGYRSMPNLTFVGRYKTGSNYYPALITVNGSGNINASYFSGTTVAAITSGTLVGSFTYVIS